MHQSDPPFSSQTLQISQHSHTQEPRETMKLVLALFPRSVVYVPIKILMNKKLNIPDSKK